jgi:hypothetical protein
MTHPPTDTHRAGGYRVEAVYGEPGERVGEPVVPGDGVAGAAIERGQPVEIGRASCRERV